MMKSIRVLLLLAVAQILFGSCFIVSHFILKRRKCLFLILIVGVSGFCAGINYFHTADQSRHSILHVQRSKSCL